MRTSSYAQVPLQLSVRGEGKLDLLPRAKNTGARMMRTGNEGYVFAPSLAAQLATPNIRVGRPLRLDGLDGKAGKGLAKRVKSIIEFTNDKQTEAVLVHSQPSADGLRRIVTIEHGDCETIRVSQKIVEA